MVEKKREQANNIIPKGDEGELVAIFADGAEWQIPAINARAHRGMRIFKGLIIVKVVRLCLTRRLNDQQRREVMRSLCALNGSLMDCKAQFAKLQPPTWRGWRWHVCACHEGGNEKLRNG